MSKPFALVCQERAEQVPPAELVERAYSTLVQWRMQSTGKLVSLDQVAWIGALLFKSGVMAIMQQEAATRESTNENGARVVTVVADDAAPVSDGAG